jgi:hypothetical protein
MESRLVALGSLAVLSTVAALAAVSTWRHPPLRLSAAPGAAKLHIFGSRGAQQPQGAAGAKFDGALADLSRHAALARPEHVLEDLHSLAPAVKFKKSAAGAAPLVLIDAITLGDPQQLKAALLGLGLQHASVYSNDVGGWLPVAQLEAATALGEVHAIRAAMSRTRSGAVTTQGDFAQHSDVVRAANSLTGAGVTVGVLSDSYNCYAQYATHGVPAAGAAGYASNGFLATASTDIASGDLPSVVDVLEEADCLDYGAPTQLPDSDEGRAMLQIVHDVAPGAGLAFYTVENSEADYASGIIKLAASVASGGAGAKVIVDDVGYFDEPFFQDGELAQAVDTVEAQGVAYFSAAGNDGNSANGNVALAYNNNAPSFATVSSAAPNSGEHLLNFDPSGATTTTSLPVTIAALQPGDFVAIVVQWDQPYVTGAANSGGATGRIDLCITGASGTDDIEGYITNAQSSSAGTCTGANALGTDPYQVLIVANPANASGNTAAENLNIQVGLIGGTTPGRIKIAVEDDGAGSTINAFPTNSGTIQGHAGAAGAFAAGAAFYFNTPACGTTPAGLEYFSSSGGDPILFDSAGTRLAMPIVRQKPDAVGPNGGNDTFLGYTLASAGVTGGLLTTSITQCQNVPAYPNFFGTSAAAPHLASIAALMLQANPTATPAQIYQALRSSALPMDSNSPNQQSGYGFVQADAAFIVPTMTLSQSAVAANTPVTLTWSSIAAATCVASGSWTGPMATSGTQTVTISTTGTNTYTLTCMDAAGTSSASNSVYLTDAAPAAPTLTISTTALVAGNAATLVWSDAGAANCTASGSWRGPVATSGSQVVTPSSAGNDIYTLACSNAVGTSPTSSVSLAVTAPPAAPTLTLAASSVAVGSSTTITWSSVNATGCTATGSWTGALAASGSKTLSPTVVGSDTYTLSCANAVGSSTPTSVTLTVIAASSSATLSGHGGGSLDWLALLGLAGLAAGRVLRLRPRVLT